MFRRYPIFHLLLPVLSGILLTAFCTEGLNIDKRVSVSIVLGCGLISAFLFRLTSKGQTYKTCFSISFFILFFFIGAALCSQAIDSAKTRYGAKWRFSVYQDNPFELTAAKQLQQKVVEFYNQKGLQGDEGAFIQSVTVGEKSNLSKEVKEAFSKAGISHLLALSGFHVGILYMILQVVFLSRIVTIRWRWISHLLTIMLLWSFAFLSGMQPSLVRSVFMCSFVILGTLHTHQKLPLNALAFSALLQLLVNPLLIFHAGFQMSYLSMLGIYFLSLPLIRLYYPYTTLDSILWCTISITIACTLFTLPIVSLTFGRISILSVFANIITLFPMYLIFIVFVFWLLTSGASFLTYIILALSSFILKTAHYISQLPYSYLEFSFTPLEAIIYYILLSLLIAYINKKQNSASILPT